MTAGFGLARGARRTEQKVFWELKFHSFLRIALAVLDDDPILMIGAADAFANVQNLIQKLLVHCA